MKRIEPADIYQRAQEYREYAANLLSRLIQVPSLSGQEEMVICFLETEFKNSGADDIQIDGFGNIIARIGSGQPVIAFDAHVDTVDTGQKELWSFPPFSGEIRDGRVWGRGASDQKGGMAAMMTALKILRDLKIELPFTALFVGSVLEEDCDGLCWQYIITEDKIVPDIVILTEPTNGQINRGHRGRMEMEITVDGVSCHGSAPERGDNAIYKLAPIILAMRELNECLPSNTFLGKGTLALSRIRSEAPSLCAVADSAAVYIDRRLTAGETPESAVREIEALAEVKAAGATVGIPQFNSPSWRGTIYPVPKTYPTWVMSPDHAAVVGASNCYRKLFQEKPVVDKWTFSTNGVATKGIFNIPTIGFGPGLEKMAHAPNEYCAIDDLVRCAAFYACYPWIVTGKI